MRKRASVLISTYNNPAYLDLVLRAYRRQTCLDFEILLADDGSGSETRAVVEKHAARHPARIRHVWHPDQGFRKARAMNRAALASEGDWLIFSDGDCLPSRTFVDTGPVLERAWAERAGVGWIGKNANLISRERGSWLLLGEVLSAAELEPDPGPHPDFCGTCTKCLEACPTGAIVEPGVVDSNRCISYWTIEHRGPIPEERRAGIGDWIFGCDVCQDVCPWNASFATTSGGDALRRRDDLRGLDAAEILGLDETAFRARYSGTPLMRAKWEGMRRNAAIVLGNRRDPAAIPALERALDDPDPVLRSHAAWALTRVRA